MPACSSSSTLGKDSDDGSLAGKEEEEEEVQSAFSEACFDGLGALEESLPIRRGISKFYSGKSRSFALLREAITPSGSAGDITKADNAYTRKRKNLMAYSIMFDKSRHPVRETNGSGSRKRLAIATARWNNAALSPRPSDSVGSSGSSSCSSSEENELPRGFNLGQSPDSTTNISALMIPVSRPGSCASKTLATPARSLSMLDFHRLHSRPGLSVCLEDKQKVE